MRFDWQEQKRIEQQKEDYENLKEELRNGSLNHTDALVYLTDMERELKKKREKIREYEEFFDKMRDFMNLNNTVYGGK